MAFNINHDNFIIEEHKFEENIHGGSARTPDPFGNLKILRTQNVRFEIENKEAPENVSLRETQSPSSVLINNQIDDNPQSQRSSRTNFYQRRCCINID